MSVWGAGKSLLKSNRDAASDSGIGRLFMSQSDLGIKSSYNDLREGGKDLRAAEKVISKSTAKKNKYQKQLEKAQEDGTDLAGQAELMDKIRHHEGKIADHREFSTQAAERTGAGIGGLWKGTRKYFTGEDLAGQDGRAMAVAARVGGAGAAYMGINGGLRYMSGGGMTYNNQGERDIAGIPFI